MAATPEHLLQRQKVLHGGVSEQQVCIIIIIWEYCYGNLVVIEALTRKVRVYFLKKSYLMIFID